MFEEFFDGASRTQALRDSPGGLLLEGFAKELFQVRPNAKLCKAMLDRLTDQAHMIETCNESYRFRKTLAKKKAGRR